MGRLYLAGLQLASIMHVALLILDICIGRIPATTSVRVVRHCETKGSTERSRPSAILVLAYRDRRAYPQNSGRTTRKYSRHENSVVNPPLS